MRILYVAMKYDYGRPEQGLSFEHYNFYHSLLSMGHDIVYFDFMTLMQEHGRAWMNTRLLEVARAEKPDLIFTVLFTDELDPAVLRTLTDDMGLLTLNWFCDDHWRFESYSQFWAPCFRWVVTTAGNALQKYAAIGYQNVIKSQWACNTFLYQKMSLPLAYDVTFIGQPYGHRRAIIDQLRTSGINVQVWGSGWDSGRVSQEEMIQIFNQSRINLNLTTAYGHNDQEAALPSQDSTSLMARLLAYTPFLQRVKSTNTARQHLKKTATADPLSITGETPTEVIHPEQIKGRNFEVPGCGGLLLTGQADNLSEYYDIGKEVVCFHKIDDMVQHIQYYLRHEDERNAISNAGYERTLRDHTYERRFKEIFAQIGMSDRRIGQNNSGPTCSGHVECIRKCD